MNDVQYKLIPQPGHITIIPLKANEVKRYTNKLLADVETTGMDVLQYGRVVVGEKTIKEGAVVMYPRLASDKTNFGDPRQVIVETAHVKGYLEEIK